MLFKLLVMLCDELGVKGDFTDADVLGVQKRYNDLGDHVSEGHVRSVLENRKELLEQGKVLDPNEVTSAKTRSTRTSP